MYELGVVGGALCFVLIGGGQGALVGCSGGVYAIFGIQIAELLMNWGNENRGFLNHWTRLLSEYRKLLVGFLLCSIFNLGYFRAFLRLLHMISDDVFYGTLAKIACFPVNARSHVDHPRIRLLRLLCCAERLNVLHSPCWWFPDGTGHRHFNSGESRGDMFRTLVHHSLGDLRRSCPSGMVCAHLRCTFSSRSTNLGSQIRHMLRAAPELSGGYQPSAE